MTSFADVINVERKEKARPGHKKPQVCPGRNCPAPILELGKVVLSQAIPNMAKRTLQPLPHQVIVLPIQKGILPETLI